MKAHALLLLCSSLLLSSCATMRDDSEDRLPGDKSKAAASKPSAAAKKKADTSDSDDKEELYFEPSIERGMELLAKTKEGKSLLDYLEKHPAGVRYAPLDGPWPKYQFYGRLILLPETARPNDKVLAVLIGRGLTIYKTVEDTRISDMLVEVEEIAALAQSRIALELGVDQEAFRQTAPGRGILREVCAYLVEGQFKILEFSRRQAISVNDSYGRPYDDISQSKMWLRKTNEGITDGNLAQVVEKRNAERVRRHMMTQEEAVRQAAKVRALDGSSALRMQREYFFSAERALDDLAHLKDKKINDDLIWRRDNEKLLLYNVNNLTECNQYVSDIPDQDFEIRPLK